jgi:hypothetical protein
MTGTPSLTWSGTTGNHPSGSPGIRVWLPEGEPPGSQTTPVCPCRSDLDDRRHLIFSANQTIRERVLTA